MTKVQVCPFFRHLKKLKFLSVLSHAWKSPKFLSTYSLTTGGSSKRPRRAVESQKVEQMASETTISNADLVLLVGKFLRSEAGSRKLAKSHLGLFASEKEVLKLKCKIEYKAKLLQEANNCEAVCDALCGGVGMLQVT